MSSTAPYDTNWLSQRIEALTGRKSNGTPRVVEDTTAFMGIERDDVIALEGALYAVRANEREGRFTIDDQPKFWVKRAVDLHTGRKHIIKLCFNEDFKIRIGELKIPCHRDMDKESRVLEIMRGDWRFMQGHTKHDRAGNNVRIIDFITGTDLLSYVDEIPLSHEEYFHRRFPEILANVIECLRAIAELHQHGLCHGDIRNDHIIVERATGRLRWIDFDLGQPFLDFDVWSAGNILHSIISKGFTTFRQVKESQPDAYGQLARDDASLFFPHRIMNLSVVYPYVPPALNRILMRFSVGTEDYFDDMDELIAELCRCASDAGWPTSPLAVTPDVPSHRERTHD